MKATYEDYYDKDEVTLQVNHYANNGNLQIQLWSEYEPFASLTVNLGEKLPADCAYLDTNNLRCAFDFCMIHKLGEFTGAFSQSGYCTYPLWKFDMNEVEKYAK